MSEKVVVFWFRRDLRLDDNVGLYHALQSGYTVIPIFIFDQDILEHLPPDDARVSFIHNQLETLNAYLKKEYNSGIHLFHGPVLQVWQELLSTYKIIRVYANHDYEPYALKRDAQLKQVLQEYEISFYSYKDQVIYEKKEIVKQDGNPYVVYTPYKNKWLERYRLDTNNPTHIAYYNSASMLSALLKSNDLANLSLQDIGFKESAIRIPNYDINKELIANYQSTRNFPSIEKGTSRLGLHLRFGTVSIRKMVQEADKAQEKTFLSELIWREFFMQILYHYPHTTTQAFKPKYDRIEWRNNEQEFEKWKNGQTGYPLVDAGMRELKATGHMHNRVRMLVASFLCKHLLIDWRWGERYFAMHLLDYELSSNVGNWQWAAGSGVDAAPYFRIFNPITQLDKFDKQRTYINKWVPEHNTSKYPNVIVDHKQARERCLQTYKHALS